MNKLKNKNGITLIALIITIIVLLILAGVVINLTMGENGIITKAQKSVEKYNEEGTKEKIKLAYASSYVEGAGTLDTSVLKTELEKTYGSGKVTVTKDGDALEISIDGVGVYSIDKLGKVELKGPPVTYNNIRVVENSNGTGDNVAKGTKIKGDSLYIYFEATVEGGTCTISPIVPYEVTKNGTYEFTINYTVDGKNYTSKKSIKVDQYLGAISQMQIGDYVKYETKLDASKTVTTNTAQTGHTDSQTFKTKDTVKWRIMDKDVENNKVTLVAAENIGDTSGNGLTLNGEAGFENAETVLDGVCDGLYSTSYGDARSIKVEDINKLSGFDQENPKTSDINLDGSKANYGETLTYSEGRYWNVITNQFEYASSENLIDVTYTYYKYLIPTTMSLYDTLVGVKNEDESYSFVDSYMMCSRSCLRVSASYVLSNFNIDGGYLGAQDIICFDFGPNGTTGNSQCNFLRPVVELNADLDFEETNESIDGNAVWKIAE